MNNIIYEMNGLCQSIEPKQSTEDCEVVNDKDKVNTFLICSMLKLGFTGIIQELVTIKKSLK